MEQHNNRTEVSVTVNKVTRTYFLVLTSCLFFNVNINEMINKSINQSINQSNVYSANTPGEARLSGTTANSVFNSNSL